MNSKGRSFFHQVKRLPAHPAIVAVELGFEASRRMLFELALFDGALGDEGLEKRRHLILGGGHDPVSQVLGLQEMHSVGDLHTHLGPGKAARPLLRQGGRTLIHHGLEAGVQGGAELPVGDDRVPDTHSGLFGGGALAC